MVVGVDVCAHVHVCALFCVHVHVCLVCMRAGTRASVHVVGVSVRACIYD